MEIKYMTLSVLLGLTVAVSACGGAAAPAPTTAPEAPAEEAMAEKETADGDVMTEKAPTEEAMMKPTEEAMLAEKATEEAMMAEKTSAEAMAEEASEEAMKEGMEQAMPESTEEVMLAEKATEEAMMEKAGTEEAMTATEPTEEAMAAPAWFQAELTNVNSGETFKISDFKGKVVLVETMAVWCPLCMRQQNHVRALHELLGERDDFVSLALDIDPNEDAEFLKAHAGNNGFDWHYAVAPPEVAREIGQLYGAQFLNPPSTPMLIIDRQGEVHLLPFGQKESTALQEALTPFLDEG